MRARTFLSALFLCLAFVGTAPAEETNPVLGKAGDFILREADLDRILASMPPDVQKRFQDDPQQRMGLIRELLTEKAVVALVKKERFDRKPEIKEQVSNLVDRFLAREYITKVVTAGLKVSDDEIKKFYQEHEKDFVYPESVKVRHILIGSTKESKPEVQEQARLKAEATLLRVKKGEDFAVLAREVSDDQNSSARGGELPPVIQGKSNSEAFEKAVFALKPGETNIVPTEYGFHIIQLIERQEKRPAPFSDVREMIQGQLKAELEQKRVMEFIELARKEAGMVITGEKPAEPQIPGDGSPGAALPGKTR